MWVANSCTVNMQECIKGINSVICQLSGFRGCWHQEITLMWTVMLVIEIASAIRMTPTSFAVELITIASMVKNGR